MVITTRWGPLRDLTPIQNELNRLLGRTYPGTEAEQAKPKKITVKANA